MDLSGGESKVRCCKEQYCTLGLWININWKWSNGRWQEWASKILGISELKWTRMGKFNSDDHYIYHCGQESLRIYEIVLIVNKRVQNAVLGCNIKNDRLISVHFWGRPFNITVIPICGPTTNAKEAEVERFYEDLWDLLELTPKKMSFSSYGTGMQK